MLLEIYKFYIGIYIGLINLVIRMLGTLKWITPKKIHVNFVFGPNVHKIELLKSTLSLD